MAQTTSSCARCCTRRWRLCRKVFLLSHRTVPNEAGDHRVAGTPPWQGAVHWPLPTCVNTSNKHVDSTDPFSTNMCPPRCKDPSAEHELEAYSRQSTTPTTRPTVNHRDRPSGRAADSRFDNRPHVPRRLPNPNLAFSAGLRMRKEHMRSSSTLITAPALSNSPQ